MDKILTAPGALSVFQGEIDGEITLKWNSVLRAVNYIVECKINKIRCKWVQVDIVRSTYCVITGLKSKKVYLFRVAAANSNSQSKWSAPLKIRIL